MAFAEGGIGLNGSAKMVLVPGRIGLANEIQRIKSRLQRWPVINCLPPDTNVRRMRTS
jgi:hypothetical protein